MTPYRLSLRVYFEDTDAGGVMYHARYLAFAERARTEALREAGVPHAELVRDHGLFFVVRRAQMDYLRPARLDDLVEVITGPWVLRAASVEVQQLFAVNGHEIATLRIMLATIRATDGRPARIPERWRVALGGNEGDQSFEPSG